MKKIVNSTSRTLPAATHDNVLRYPARKIAEKDLVKAHYRIMGYLRALNAPPKKGLEIALEVLKRIQYQTKDKEDIHPVKSGLDAVRDILAEQNLFSTNAPIGSQWFRYCRSLYNNSTKCNNPCRRVIFMPRIKRSTMVPEIIG